MISPRITKVLRDVGSNKSRTMLVVMSIAIGVFAVGTTLTIRDVMAREMQRNWDISSPRSARINLQGFGQDFVNSIRQMPEIAEAEGRSNAFARAQVNGSDELKYIIVNAVDKFDDMRLDKIEKENVPPGAWPPAKREIILSAQALAFLNVKVGEMVQIKMPNNKPAAASCLRSTALSPTTPGNGWIKAVSLALYSSKYRNARQTAPTFKKL
jgi:putative ABC transport system permease protein